MQKFYTYINSNHFTQKTGTNDELLAQISKPPLSATEDSMYTASISIGRVWTSRTK